MMRMMHLICFAVQILKQKSGGDENGANGGPQRKAARRLSTPSFFSVYSTVSSNVNRLGLTHALNVKVELQHLLQGLLLVVVY